MNAASNAVAYSKLGVPQPIDAPVTKKINTVPSVSLNARISCGWRDFMGILDTRWARLRGND